MPNNCSGVRMDGLQNCLYSTIYNLHQCGVWTFKRFEDLSLTCFMHELDCASSIAYFIIHLCPILSLLKNKRMKKQKPRLFILRAAINFGHFWHGTPRSKTIILASFSQKTKTFYVSLIVQISKSCPQNDKVLTCKSLWWLSYLQWVSDGSPSHSHATKIENNNQFVPVNTNPKEFKKVQKLVRSSLDGLSAFSLSCHSLRR